MLKRWSLIGKIAAVYVGTVIGAGFASGQEILRFFNIYGLGGLIGIGVSMILFIWFGTTIMLFSSRIKAYSYQEFNTFLLGNKLGLVVNVFIFIMLIGVTSAMLSGTGAIFAEQLHLPKQIGIFLTLILCYFVMQKGIDGVFGVNSIIVPIMILFCLIIGILTITSLPAHEAFYLLSFSSKDLFTIKWLFSAFAYVALNLTLAQAVLVPIGREVDDASIIRWGGLWGGLALSFMLLCSYLAQQLMMPEILRYEIPMANVVKKYGHWLYLFFLFVIYGEIFTTFVGNIFGVTRQLSTITKLNINWIILIVLMICLLVSQLGFSFMVTYLYPLLGYVAIIILLSILIKYLITE